MGLFNFFSKHEEKAVSSPVTFPASLGAVSAGHIILMSDIPDKVFSKGVLGICCGIEPQEGKVYAPIDGTISQLADSLHAIGMEASGMEILIHVGIDTVDMNGDGFANHVRINQSISKKRRLIADNGFG